MLRRNRRPSRPWRVALAASGFALAGCGGDQAKPGTEAPTVPAVEQANKAGYDYMKSQMKKNP